MPAWVTDATAEYTKRMPAQRAVQWIEIRTEPRTKNDSTERCLNREAERIESALPANGHLVLLDETGSRCTTRKLSEHLSHWQELGKPASLIIGGPDGVHKRIKDIANQQLRLSDLTLPHPLVRVLLAEQLYRASTILDNHPYHRA
jgi:23S rRNA (pseudouridine1915-N3)-methyltransferase